jgi:hypothetical protein
VTTLQQAERLGRARARQDEARARVKRIAGRTLRVWLGEVLARVFRGLR